MRPTLFGVTIPEAAIRVVIRPILGPGGAQPLYEARFDVGSEPTEKGVRTDVANDQDFWAYIDSRVRASKLEPPRDGSWSWKLRLQFYNQLNSDEAFLTEDFYEFYRIAAVPRASAEAPWSSFFEKALLVIDQLNTSSNGAMEKVQTSCAAAVTSACAAASAAACASIAQSASAAAAALIEVSKQTSVVSDVLRLLQAETVELKDGIFELQTKAAQAPAKSPKTATEELKEVVDAGKMMMGLVETFTGPTTPIAATPPASATPGTPPGEL